MNKKIKVKTYDGMYYTYCYIDSNKEEVNTLLINLYKIINEDKFIFLPIENKILNTKDIKETLIGI